MPITNLKNFNTQKLEAALFVTLGAVRTVHDYRTVGEDYKRKILVNDITVLGASTAGMLGYKALGRSKFLNDKIFNPIVKFSHEKLKAAFQSKFIRKIFSKNFDKVYKTFKTTFEYSEKIVANTISNTLMVGSGLSVAILADYFLSKGGYSVHKIKEKRAKDAKEHYFKSSKMENFIKDGVDQVVSKDIQKEMLWRMTDFKAFKVFNSTFIGLAGLDITDDRKSLNQIRHASKYLIFNTMIPFLFFSISSALTLKIKTIYRIPIMFTTLVAASLAVKHITDKKELADTAQKA